MGVDLLTCPISMANYDERSLTEAMITLYILPYFSSTTITRSECFIFERSTECRYLVSGSECHL